MVATTPVGRPVVSEGAPAYGLWLLVVVNSAIFILFAFSFFKPRTKRTGRELHAAQQQGRLAMAGPYAWVRHPQYDGFVLVMLGFLLQWPTLLTLAMFPILAWMYLRLARAEEQESIATFGDAYRDYTARVTSFIPRISQPTAGRAH